ncbi:MAG: PTS system mannose/fructose/sorbose family transporter subunit IID [Elusimicrobiota bacterium]
MISKIFFRSLFLQAVWNYEKLQSEGFLFSIFPKLKELYTNEEKLRESCRRHQGYFNTHPYMSLFILGTVARLEEDIKNGKPGAEERMARYKLQMGGPLAALGDKLFWSNWRPIVCLIGIIGFFMEWRPYYLIPLIFILLYNIPVLIFKQKALMETYNKRTDIARIIRAINSNLIVKILPIIMLLAVGIILFMGVSKWGINRGLLLIVLTFAVAFVRKYTKTTEIRLFYIISCLTILGRLILF